MFKKWLKRSKNEAQCAIQNVSVSVAAANNDGNCITCRFNKNDNCTVGTYYAEKGQKAICYEGELWEATER